MKAPKTILSDQQQVALLEVAAPLARMGYWYVNLKLNTVWWSDEVFRIHGYQPRSFQPQLEQAINFYHPDDREIVSSAIANSQEKGENFEFECRIIAKDRSTRNVRSVGFCEKDGIEVVGMFGLIFDESEQQQRRVALASEKTRLSLATAAGGIGVWEVDLKNDQPSWDDRMFQIHGLCPSKEKPQTLEDWNKLIHPDDLPQTIESVQFALKNKSDCDINYRVIRPNGELRYIRSSAIVQRDPNSDKAIRVIGINYDLTDWHELQRRTEESMAAEERASRMKSEFLANMSHEIRTPLNAIMGFSEVLTTDALRKGVPEKYQSYATDIHDAATHLLKLINDVLDISRVESGKFEPFLQPVDPHEIIEKVIRQSRKAIADKKHVCSVEYRHDFDLSADIRMLQQIVQNILTNAINYSPEGSKIDICVSRGPAGYGAILISDTGYGVSEENQEKIFEPFTQVRDNPYQAYEGGTGLGLPLCKHLCEICGGQLVFSSTLGKGTRVRVLLPLVLS